MSTKPKTGRPGHRRGRAFAPVPIRPRKGAKAPSRKVTLTDLRIRALSGLLKRHIYRGGHVATVEKVDFPRSWRSTGCTGVTSACMAATTR